jgi:hypothetical protein
MKYIGNAFSCGMLSATALADGVKVGFRSLSLDEARAYAAEEGWLSCVGHADTALLVSSLLGADVPMRRVGTELCAGDELLVAQYNGARLPEGATSLPEGATIRWILATVPGAGYDRAETAS